MCFWVVSCQISNGSCPWWKVVLAVLYTFSFGSRCFISRMINGMSNQQYLAASIDLVATNVEMMPMIGIDISLAALVSMSFSKLLSAGLISGARIEVDWSNFIICINATAMMMAGIETAALNTAIDVKLG